MHTVLHCLRKTRAQHTAFVQCDALLVFVYLCICVFVSLCLCGFVCLWICVCILLSLILPCARLQSFSVFAFELFSVFWTLVLHMFSNALGPCFSQPDKENTFGLSLYGTQDVCSIVLHHSFYFGNKLIAFLFVTVSWPCAVLQCQDSHISWKYQPACLRHFYDEQIVAFSYLCI